MNYGDCPYEDCEGMLWFAVPDRTPVFAFVECDACHRVVWYRFSRLDPMAYTIEDFYAEYVIDETTNLVTLRNPPPPMTPELEQALDRWVTPILAELVAEEIAKVMHGDPSAASIFAGLIPPALLPLPLALDRADR